MELTSLGKSVTYCAVKKTNGKILHLQLQYDMPWMNILFILFSILILAASMHQSSP